MADEGFEVETALVDHMSAPAETQAKALGHLKGALEGVAKAEKKEEEHSGFLGKAWEKAKDFGHEFTSSLIPQIAAAELAAEGIKKLGEALIEGVHFALEAAEFKENMMLAYSAVTGTAEEGEKTFDAIDKLADQIHMPAEKAHDLASSLMFQGMENVDQIKSTIQAVSDLQRVGLARGADRIQTLIERSLSTGHLELSKKTLAGTGLSIDALAEDLSHRLHKSVAQIKQELKAGKIDAEVGIASITDAINHGKIGEAAGKKFDLTDALTDMKNSFTKLFQDVDTAPLKQALFDVASALGMNAEKGGTLHEVFTFVFNEAIKWVSRAIEWLTEFALDLEIYGLKAYISLFPIIDGVMRIYHEIGHLSDALLDLKGTGESVFPHLAKLATMMFEPLAGAAKALGLDVAGGGGVSKAMGLGIPGAVQAAPHAEGGVVAEAPPGEAFAAVKPGEIILPERFASQMLSLGNAPSNDNRSVELHWHGDVVVHGGDPQEVRQAVTSSLADVLEQVALEMGG